MISARGAVTVPTVLVQVARDRAAHPRGCPATLPQVQAAWTALCEVIRAQLVLARPVALDAASFTIDVSSHTVARRDNHAFALRAFSFGLAPAFVNRFCARDAPPGSIAVAGQPSGSASGGQHAALPAVPAASSQSGLSPSVVASVARDVMRLVGEAVADGKVVELEIDGIGVFMLKADRLTAAFDPALLAEVFAIDSRRWPSGLRTEQAAAMAAAIDGHGSGTAGRPSSRSSRRAASACGRPASAAASGPPSGGLRYQGGVGAGAAFLSRLQRLIRPASPAASVCGTSPEAAGAPTAYAGRPGGVRRPQTGCSAVNLALGGSEAPAIYQTPLRSRPATGSHAAVVTPRGIPAAFVDAATPIGPAGVGRGPVTVDNPPPPAAARSASALSERPAFVPAAPSGRTFETIASDSAAPLRQLRVASRDGRPASRLALGHVDPNALPAGSHHPTMCPAQRLSTGRVGALRPSTPREVKPMEAAALAGADAGESIFRVATPAGADPTALQRDAVRHGATPLSVNRRRARDAAAADDADRAAVGRDSPRRVERDAICPERELLPTTDAELAGVAVPRPNGGAATGSVAEGDDTDSTGGAEGFAIQRPPAPGPKTRDGSLSRSPPRPAAATQRPLLGSARRDTPTTDSRLFTECLSTPRDRHAAPPAHGAGRAAGRTAGGRTPSGRVASSRADPDAAGLTSADQRHQHTHHTLDEEDVFDFHPTKRHSTFAERSALGGAGVAEIFAAPGLSGDRGGRTAQTASSGGGCRVRTASYLDDVKHHGRRKMAAGADFFGTSIEGGVPRRGTGAEANQQRLGRKRLAQSEVSGRSAIGDILLYDNLD